MLMLVYTFGFIYAATLYAILLSQVTTQKLQAHYVTLFVR